MRFRRVRKNVALLLVMVLLSTFIAPVFTVSASDVSGETTEETVMQDSEREIIEENQTETVQNQISDEQETTIEEDTQNDESVNIDDKILLNYIGVDFPYLATPDEQKIFLSFGDGAEEITEAKLLYKNQEGESFELPLAERQDELYLFKKSFDESEAGVYELTDFVYVINGEEITLNLIDIGANALFGVDEYYSGYDAGDDEIKDAEISMSVVDVDTNDVEEAETDVAGAIEAAAEEVAEVPDTRARSAAFSARVKANNVIVVLDPGHGGSDSGALGHGLQEKDLTLRIAQYCKAELEEYDGVTVYMTREGDSYVDLYERVEKYAHLKPNVFVSIHINSASSSSAKGVEIWYPNQNYNATIHSQGYELSSKILHELVQLGLTNRGLNVKTNQQSPIYPDGSLADYYAVIRRSKELGFPGIIVEHAFISNADDANKLRQDSFLKQCGIADATGIANYFGLTKNPTVRIYNKNDFRGTGTISYTGCKGAAEVRIYNEKNPSDVRKYPVSYSQGTIALNIADYNMAGGKYIVGVYDGAGGLMCSASCMFSSDPSSKIEITTSDEITYNVKLTFADMPDIVKEVRFPIWQQEDQKDLIWHNAVQTSAGVWEANVKTSSYNKAGIYNVHYYAVSSDGTSYCLGGSSMTITEPSAKMRIDNIDKKNGSFDVVIEDVISPSGIKQIQVPVWTAANQSDIKWYAVEEKNGNYVAHVSMANHNCAIGTYQIHGYLTAGNGLYKFLGGTTQIMELPEMDLSVENKNGKDTEYLMSASNPDVFGVITNVQFAVWSETDGQDDLIWYQGSKNASGIWTATADITRHKTAGNYQMHVYATLANGTMKFLGARSFEVSKPKADVSVENYDPKAGTFDVSVKVDGASTLSGVKEVQIPVWCAQNQSDMRWYTADKAGDDLYKVHVSMANHNCAAGEYKIHTYITAGNGVRAFIGQITQNVVMPELELSVNDVSGTQMLYAMKATNPGVLGVLTKVQFAVWSETGGQDDLIWYQGSRDAAGVWTATADILKHKTAGSYQMHVYATLANGTMRFLGARSFEVSKPKADVSVENYNPKAGTFDVSVKVDGASASSGVKEVQIPVWCASDQSDMRWYTADKAGDGLYKVHVSMANHNCAVGEYKIHTYITTGNGVQAFIGQVIQNVVMPELELSVDNVSGDQTLYKMKAENLEVFGIITNVQFAVWSETGGQDDLIWYQGSKDASGAWTATADIQKHKTAGNYQMHVYATLANGTMKFLGARSFEVNKPKVGKVDFSECDKDSGAFTVTISDIESASGVKKVQVPVWCASDQSDIKWYTAVKQDDKYVVNVDPVFHGYHSGIYSIHVYVTTGNGLNSFVYGGAQEVTAAKFYTIMGESTVTKEQLIAYFKASSHSYPSVYAAKGAGSIEEFCQIYMEEAAMEGVRVEVAFAQAMKETGWLQFGGIVRPDQCNFAGIGALDGNSVGNCAVFPDVRTGIRAQIQHLKAYGSTDPLKNAQVDPRFMLVKRGSAPYVEYLGINDYPVGIGWATSPGYGFSIVSMIKTLKSY